MNAIATILLVAYFAAIGVICVYGLHRYWQVGALLRHARTPVEPKAPPAALPRVTIQLPMFNEGPVAERVIRAACAMDYPRDRLQVQVLDDSTDESAELVARTCETLRAQGHDVEHLHRSERTGFKAGALADGLETATGEFVAVFDADFSPAPDFLQRTLGHFDDERVGLVQTRWSHLNRTQSLLTEVQAICLDGHFLVEQLVRARTGRWFNFNGTAGIWRRACIDDAGGWQIDTLTEDTDLSYRAQLKGWRFEFLPDVCVDSEIPPTIAAMTSQQHRWSKGLAQNAIKLLPVILRSKAPLAAKIEAWFHLTSPIVYVALLALAITSVPTLWIERLPASIDPSLAPAAAAVCLLLGTLGATVFFVSAQLVAKGRPWRTLLLVPLLMAIGVGLSVINSKAVGEALLGLRSPFVRTPKFAGGNGAASDPALARVRRLPRGLVETVLSSLMLGCFFTAFEAPVTLVGAPFLLLFATGFAVIGVPRVMEWAGSINQARKTPVAAR